MDILQNADNLAIQHALSISPYTDQDEVKVAIERPLPSAEVQAQIVSLWTRTYGWDTLTFTPKGAHYEVTVTRAVKIVRPASDSNNVPEIYSTSSWGGSSGGGNSVMDQH
jgi:hypothetical protein